MRNSLLSSTLFLSLSPTICRADCYRDNDWTISMIDKHTYFAAIPRDGKWHDLEYAQCLSLETRACIPCSSILPTKISYSDKMPPCWAYFAAIPKSGVANSTTVASSNITTLELQRKGSRVRPVTIDLFPPRQILSLKCGT